MLEGLRQGDDLRFGEGSGFLQDEFVEFGDLGVDEGALVFEVGEFVEEGWGVSAFGDGAGKVGDLGGKFFLFGVQGFELYAFFCFDVVIGAGFDGKHFFEDFGDEDVVVEGIEYIGFKFFASDASLGATCAAFGAGATVGFVAPFCGDCIG